MKYEYVIKRSQRRTLSVSVSSDNTITVHSPMRTSVSTIEKFLSRKSAWLDRHIKKNNEVIAANGLILSYDKILIGGVAVPLVLGKSNRAIIERAENGGIIPENSFVEVTDINNLKKTLTADLGKSFNEEYSSISKKTGLFAASVSFKDYKSRWGCCDGINNIVFNYKILMLPAPLREYIVVHELCHTVHHDHSAKFHALLCSLMPDYKKRVAALKRYSFLIRLY